MTRRWDVVGIAASTLFVVFWATGFIGAKATMPHADAFWLLFLRFSAAVVLLGAIVLVLRRPWPRTRQALGHLAVAGILIHLIYLGGVFVAVKYGLQANAISTIVSAQPLLTAFAAAILLGEAVSARKWIGLFLGAAGVLLTIAGKLSAGLGTIEGVGLAIIALVGISLGTLYQKKYCQNLPILSGLVVQYAVAGILSLLISLGFEDQSVNWTLELILGLGWLVIILSCVAVMLLYFLIKRGAATNVASLFFLVPGVTAVIAWVLYREPLGVPAFIGLVLVSIAVFLVNWQGVSQKADAQ